MQEQKFCPYPGLRPFTEEESIFFKGREEQVSRIVKRLGEKRFLMINGASGDGKSSLMYAGVIPFAKAGFFKSTFDNWAVVNFRPERKPLSNFPVPDSRPAWSAPRAPDLAAVSSRPGLTLSLKMRVRSAADK